MLYHAISLIVFQIILAVIWSRGYFQASEIFYEFHGEFPVPSGYVNSFAIEKWPFIVDFSH